MDVNPLKPVPVVRPPRKVDRERWDRGKEHAPAEEVEPEDAGNDGKRIDTYA